MNSFAQILINHYSEDVYHTHVSMIQPRGKFSFSRYELNDFYKSYRSYKDSKGIAEAPQQGYMPIIVDIDLGISETDGTSRNLYTIDNVKEVIQVYNEVILSSVNNVSLNDLTCVFLSKNPYIKNDKLKHGFHLHYPKIFIDSKKFKNVLFPKINALFKQRNIYFN
jgi:hypothetical protein